MSVLTQRQSYLHIFCWFIDEHHYISDITLYLDIDGLLCLRPNPKLSAEYIWCKLKEPYLARTQFKNESRRFVSWRARVYVIVPVLPLKF